MKGYSKEANWFFGSGYWNVAAYFSCNGNFLACISSKN